MKNLKELCLGFNELRELDLELFKGLNNLEKLILVDNIDSMLTHFDSKIVNIKEINLYSNCFKNKKEISDQFKRTNFIYRNTSKYSIHFKSF